MEWLDAYRPRLSFLCLHRGCLHGVLIRCACRSRRFQEDSAPACAETQRHHLRCGILAPRISQLPLAHGSFSGSAAANCHGLSDHIVARPLHRTRHASHRVGCFTDRLLDPDGASTCARLRRRSSHHGWKPSCLYRSRRYVQPSLDRTSLRS